MFHKSVTASMNSQLFYGQLPNTNDLQLSKSLHTLFAQLVFNNTYKTRKIMFMMPTDRMLIELNLINNAVRSNNNVPCHCR